MQLWQLAKNNEFVKLASFGFWDPRTQSTLLLYLVAGGTRYGWLGWGSYIHSWSL